MQNRSKIESFFSSLNFRWQELIEFLPIGVIFFDDNWKIKSVNRNFSDFFEAEWIDVKLEGINLFSKNALSEKLPLKEVLQLREGKHFEKLVSLRSKNDKTLDVIIKGSPIFKDGVFNGGTLVLEDYRCHAEKPNLLLSESNSLLSFINKICKCFVVLKLDGSIEFISNSEQGKNSFLEGSENQNFSDIFSSEQENAIKDIIDEIIDHNVVKSLELSYFSEKEKLTFNSVFLPFTDENNLVTSIVVLLREKNSIEDDSISFLSDSAKLREYESFATADSNGLFKINLHGNITYWDKNAEELLGFSTEEILLNSIETVFPKVNQQFFEKIRKELLDKKLWEGFLAPRHNLDEDDLLKVKIVSKIIHDSTNLFVYCNKVEKQAQKIISAKEEESIFFRDAVIKSNQMILKINPHGIIQFVNEKFCKEYEYNLDEIQGKYFIDFLDNEFVEKNKIDDFDVLLGQADKQILPLVSKSGIIREVCFSLNVSTINTEPNYFTFYLKECNLKDKLLLETTHSLLYQFQEAVMLVYEERIIKVNPKFCDLFRTEFESDYYNIDVFNIIDLLSKTKFENLLKIPSLENVEKEITLVRNDKTKLAATVAKISHSAPSNFSVFTIHPLAENVKSTSDISSKIKKEFKNFGPFFWNGKAANKVLNAEYISSDFVKSIGYHDLKSKDIKTLLKQIIHPNDIDQVEREIGKVVSGENENPSDITYRIISKDGEVVWINNRVKYVTDDDENIFYGAITDVTKSVLEKEELRSIISELDKLNTAKEKFISIISHDLKSPFTSIVGFSELILTDTTLEKDEILEYVGNIKDASLHTVDLLNGLLDLTKLQTGRIDVEPRIVNAGYLVNKTVEILSGLAFQKGIALNSSVDKSTYINVDDNLVFQVFNNLVANSIKFTPKGGSIDISSREIPEQQKMEFTIRDTGVGMEQEDLKKLFVIDKKFTTLGTEGERGTGLGLSLVKEIIDKHNSKIWVNSEMGKGTEFTFTLPISSPAILIVDGTESERIVYSRLLESITDSIPILQAKDETAALKIIKDEMPMLIVFDHQLPTMKGDKFLEEIHKLGLTYHPSFIVLAKQLDKELKDFYVDIDIDDVFNKPFDLKEFKSRLDVLTGQIE